MKRLSILKTIVLTAMLSIGIMGGAHAAEAGTPAEAELLVKKAVMLVKSAGPEKAYDEISNGKSLKDRDLYIFVYDMTGKTLAHGANPRLVGKDLSGLKDTDGKLVLKLVLDLAKEKGKGWTEEFKFLNPTTQKIERKIVYIERLGETVIGSGVYKN
ncbi:cache domain-containing protein [Polaromonas sp. DSR2-3-2]